MQQQSKSVEQQEPASKPDAETTRELLANKDVTLELHNLKIHLQELEHATAKHKQSKDVEQQEPENKPDAETASLQLAKQTANHNNQSMSVIAKQQQWEDAEQEEPTAKPDAEMHTLQSANKDAPLELLSPHNLKIQNQELEIAIVKLKHSKDVEEEEREDQEDAETQSLQNANKDATLSTSVTAKQQQWESVEQQEPALKPDAEMHTLQNVNKDVTLNQILVIASQQQWENVEQQELVSKLLAEMHTLQNANKDAPILTHVQEDVTMGLIAPLTAAKTDNVFTFQWTTSVTMETSVLSTNVLQRDASTLQRIALIMMHVPKTCVMQPLESASTPR